MVNNCIAAAAHLHNFKFKYSLPELPLCGYGLHARRVISQRQNNTPEFPSRVAQVRAFIDEMLLGLAKLAKDADKITSRLAKMMPAVPVRADCPNATVEPSNLEGD